MYRKLATDIHDCFNPFTQVAFDFTDVTPEGVRVGYYRTPFGEPDTFLFPDHQVFKKIDKHNNAPLDASQGELLDKSISRIKQIIILDGLKACMYLGKYVLFMTMHLNPNGKFEYKIVPKDTVGLLRVEPTLEASPGDAVRAFLSGQNAKTKKKHMSGLEVFTSDMGQFKIREYLKERGIHIPDTPIPSTFTMFSPGDAPKTLNPKKKETSGSALRPYVEGLELPPKPKKERKKTSLLLPPGIKKGRKEEEEEEAGNFSDGDEKKKKKSPAAAATITKPPPVEGWKDELVLSESEFSQKETEERWEEDSAFEDPSETEAKTNEEVVLELDLNIEVTQTGFEEFTQSGFSPATRQERDDEDDLF